MTRGQRLFPFLRPFACLLLGLLAVSIIYPACSQTTHNMADMQAVPPPEQLPVPIKMEGIGNSHIAIKATPEAQAWFDQGLSLSHDFWDYEAAKAFQQSIRVDPKCAMCWWGLAWSLGFRGTETKVYAKHALAEAVKLEDQASDTDKVYIEAAKLGQDAKEDTPPEAIALFRKLVSDHPHDIEARIFLAEAVGDGYDDAGEPKPGEKEEILILQGVLQDAPNDSAANHYWIHAVEPGNHPEQALNAAEKLASLAPASGHMVHMPGHIYFRVGDYATAEHWFAQSTEADEHYMREQHVSPDDDWNYIHNLMYAIANLMEEGKLKQANALSDHAREGRGKLSASLYIWSARDQVARLNNRLPVALRLGDLDAVATMAAQAKTDGANSANLRALAAELGDYAKGMKALEAGDVAAAQASSNSMDAGLWRMQQRVADEKAAKKDDDKKDTKDDQAAT